jgi:sodium/hydrogen exchanger-like protein 6/7
VNFTFVDFFKILGNFLENACLSVIMGLAFGLFATLLTKKVRVFSKIPKLETTIVFFLGFLSYLISEIAHLSGVITILVCGISMSHYLIYNISEKA